MGIVAQLLYNSWRTIHQEGELRALEILSKLQGDIIQRCHPLRNLALPSLRDRA